jgi:hypothetical protein
MTADDSWWQLSSYDALQLSTCQVITKTAGCITTHSSWPKVNRYCPQSHAWSGSCEGAALRVSCLEIRSDHTRAQVGTCGYGCWRGEWGAREGRVRGEWGASEGRVSEGWAKGERRVSEGWAKGERGAANGSNIKLLTPELNPSAQRCLTRICTGDFASLNRSFR